MSDNDGIWFPPGARFDPEPDKPEARKPNGEAPHIEVELPPIEPPAEGPPEPPDPPADDGPRGRPVPEGLPVITCSPGELQRMKREAYAAIRAKGSAIYRRGMLIFQPGDHDYRTSDGSTQHSAALLPFTAPALLDLLSGVAVWQRWDARMAGGGAFRECDPPDKLVQMILHDRTGWPFQTVRGILTTPTLRPDGSLLTEPGYDPTSQYFLMFPAGFELPAIPDYPTKADAAEALARLDQLLDSYPFVDKASHAVALCMLMTQVLRCAMPVSPLLAVSAKAPGTGKSHLVDLCSTVATGGLCPIIGAGKNDEEAEKRLNTMLLTGVPGFSVDNVTRDLDLDTLNHATERPRITIRIFGTLSSIEVDNGVTIYMTGNNLAIVDEQGRRTFRCDLDAAQENPERRHFSGDPIYTARANRAQYVADILMIARAYHVGNERVAPFTIGSYGAWSHFVREPLIWLGQADPAETQAAAARDDPATVRLTRVLSCWAAKFGINPKTLAAAVSEAALDPDREFFDTLREQFPARGGQDVDTTKMGYWMRRFAGRVVNKMRFVRYPGVMHGTVQWMVERV